MATQMTEGRNRYDLSSRRSQDFQSVRRSIPYKKSSHVKKRKAVPFVEDELGLRISFDENEYMSLIRDKPSDSGDEEVDEGSEASAETYALIAVDHDKKYGNLELLDAGPLAAGNISGGRIFHFNYRAKNMDVTGAQPQTFFCEMTKTKECGLTVHTNLCLGPSDSLPEKANTQGCLYCLSHNIHHHFHRFTFESGGLQFFVTLRSELWRLSDYLKKGMKEKNFSPKFKHPGMVYVGKGVNCTKDQFAKAALHMFNLEQRTNFDLVRIGSWKVVFVSIGPVYHLNFEAKRNDDPDAEMHTFFAQVIERGQYFFAHFCKCLGKSDSLPDEIELHGCQYCTPRDSSESPCVRHPPGPGYFTGLEGSGDGS